MDRRTLEWEGLVNGRDLGGLHVGGGPIRPGRVARSASPHKLTAAGWNALVDHGIDSTLDLRHEWEIAETAEAVTDRPADVATLSYSVEPPGFVESFRDADQMWQLATPAYYCDFVTDHSDRLRIVLEMIADAPGQGVLIHCYAGRDRAGLVISVLLNLLGADHDVIVSDHWMSFDRDKPIEADLAKSTHSGGLLPLSQEKHHQLMSEFLATDPARRCFSSCSQMTAVRDRLHARLVTEA